MLQWLKEPEQHFSDQAHPLDMGICARQFERCGLSQSTVSAHLASLHKAGLITSKKIGQWIFYKRDEDAIANFLAQLTSRLYSIGPKSGNRFSEKSDAKTII